MAPLLRSARSRALLSGALALALGASLAPATLSAASADEVAPVLTLPTCPQGRMNVGIALPTSPALSQDDPFAEASISAGDLPAGVSLVGASATRTPYRFVGTPTTAGTYTFTVKATLTDDAPKTIACTVKVGELPAPTRISGTDRYDQAAKVSQSHYQPETTTVLYVASGEKFADALSAGSVAGVHKAPLLLTQSSAVPPATAAEIRRLSPTNIVVVGGPNSISDAVVTELGSFSTAATVTRISGADRYSGSRALIADPDYGIPQAYDIYLADGRNFPDALAASPAAVGWNAPVLLVDGAKTAPSAEELTLLTGLETETITIAGGVNSVSQALQDSFATHVQEVTRFSGSDRYEGAVAINQDGFELATTAYLASGEVFPDALSAGPLAGETRRPVYLVHKDCVPGSVLDDLARVKASKIVILGGTNTVGAEVAALKPC
ncbi:MAG: cell wall-binding repeat-containing protein [Herbiconiux sp.]|nr:cell wall-binding repeat-containing protein [Herbiconiux sp.]